MYIPLGDAPSRKALKYQLAIHLIAFALLLTAVSLVFDLYINGEAGLDSQFSKYRRGVIIVPHDYEPVESETGSSTFTGSSGGSSRGSSSTEDAVDHAGDVMDSITKNGCILAAANFGIATW